MCSGLRSILRRLIVVTHAINFNNQPGTVAIEVNHIRSNRMLATEFQSTDLAVPQGQPQKLFGRSFFAAQGSRRARSCAWKRTAFGHGYSASKALTLTLSRKGMRGPRPHAPALTLTLSRRERRDDSDRPSLSPNPLPQYRGPDATSPRTRRRSARPRRRCRRSAGCGLRAAVGPAPAPGRPAGRRSWRTASCSRRAKPAPIRARPP